MESEFVMFVVSAPKEHAETVRKAMGDAGAGTLGDYTYCSFSYEGEGRFMPGEQADPAYGKKGEVSMVPEIRIEMLCDRSKIKGVVTAVKKMHPYEEPAYHYFPVEIE